MNHLEDSTQHEYAMASMANRVRDEKKRLVIDTMTDREIQEETLGLLRQLADILEAVGQSPMAAAMMPALSRLGK